MPGSVSEITFPFVISAEHVLRNKTICTTIEPSDNEARWSVPVDPPNLSMFIY